MRALLSGPEVAPSLRETGRASGAAVGRKGYPKAGRLTSLWPNFGLTLAMLRCGVVRAWLKHARQPERQREGAGAPRKADGQRREPPGAHEYYLKRENMSS